MSAHAIQSVGATTRCTRCFRSVSFEETGGNGRIALERDGSQHECSEPHGFWATVFRIFGGD